MSAAPVRILFTGSRDLRDRHTVIRALSTTLGRIQRGRPAILIHGAGPGRGHHPGADALADSIWRDWGRTWPRLHLPAEKYPADWDRYGKAAGPRRNAEMVASGATVCVTIAAANSVGTVDCATKARAARIPVFDFGVTTATNPHMHAYEQLGLVA